MRLFNLTCGLLFVIAGVFPIYQAHLYNLYRDLGITLPSLTILILSPFIPMALAGIGIIKLWIHANLKNHIPTNHENLITLVAIGLFLVVSVLAFVMPFFRCGGLDS